MIAVLSTLPQLGQVLIGLYFTFFGFWNIYHWRPLIEEMLAKKLPSPFLILSISILWQCFSGMMIMFGLYVKVMALSLIPFTILAGFIFHPFWQFKAEHRRLNVSLFVANLTISLGALILLLNTISPLTSTAEFLN